MIDLGPPASIIVTPTSLGLTTAEAGGDGFLHLGRSPAGAPTADVTIPLSSSDQSEGMVSPAIRPLRPPTGPRLLVIVTGVDDFGDDGNAYTIRTSRPSAAMRSTTAWTPPM